MRYLPRFLILIGFLAALLASPNAASAHPLGNFTINHYAGLRVGPEAVTLDYVVDMAEIPAYTEISTLDADGSGRAEGDEPAAYPAAACEALRPDLHLSLNSRSLALALTGSAVEFPTGQGGLPTLRLSCLFQADLPELAQGARLVFENNAYARRPGWREIVVIPDGVGLQGEYAAESLSSRLQAYPQDLLAAPPDQRRVSLEVLPGGLGQSPAGERSAGESPAAAAPRSRDDAFTRLVLQDELTPPALLFALAVAFAWGAMHALTPGHGKTVVGAYLVGSRGTARHALYLGLTTTITHTAGVFALGLITLFAARFILPERLFPWLSFLSGLLVAGIGLNLFVARLRRARLPRGDRHSHGQVSLLALEPRHSHEHRHALVALAGSGHPHDPVHTHPHGWAHDHGHPHRPNHDHDDLHAHRHLDKQAHSPDHPHPHDHEHGPDGHSHLPPGADGAPVTWRSLLALGISGGLLPCPSALVVLLSAIALDRVGLGLALVFAFSLGLAGVLTAIGLLFVYAGRLFARLPVSGTALRLIPALSALLIALVGLGISLRSLAETGLISWALF